MVRAAAAGSLAFDAGPAWVTLRCLGMLVVACVYFEGGPLRLPHTGITVVYDIA